MNLLRKLVPKDSVIAGFAVFAFFVGCFAAWLVASRQASLNDRKVAIAAGAFFAFAGSLCVTLNNRNASLSDRIRMLSREILALDDNWSADKAKRVESIRWQVGVFEARYTANSVTLVAFAFCLGLSALVLLSVLPAEQDGISDNTSFFLSLNAGLMTFAVLVTISDFVLGIRTIDNEVDFVNHVCNALIKKPSDLDDETNEAIIHFSNVYHRLWYVDRISRTMQAPRQTDGLLIFWMEFYGLHQEQYFFWLNKLLPYDLFNEWMIDLRARAQACVNYRAQYAPNGQAMAAAVAPTNAPTTQIATTPGPLPPYDDILGFSFQDGWNLCSKYFCDEGFKSLMNSVLEGKDLDLRNHYETNRQKKSAALRATP